MRVDPFFEHADRVVIMGCSCVGKSTMARLMTDHHYVCFDSLFPWHEIETFGLSTTAALQSVKEFCEQFPKFVLDGWHLSDVAGDWFPEGVAVYVLYADYDQVIDQYRRPVDEHEEHREMFNKWYDLEYEKYPGVRYFENCRGEFAERFVDDFRYFLSTKSMN